MAETAGRAIRIENVAPPDAGRAIRVDAAGKPVAIFNVGSRLYAVDARCTHVGGPLDQGKVTGSTVECPWHGSQFDLATGQVRRGPAQSPLRAFRVQVDGSALVLESA